MSIQILQGDARVMLPTLAERSVQCCVTSPPYFGLRAYLPDGHVDKAKEIGLEATPDAYVAQMVAVFREVRRVLRDDGTLWLNLGDSYASGEVGRHDHAQAAGLSAGATIAGRARIGEGMAGRKQARLETGLPLKNLIGIPWRVAFALQADGWYLRDCIIWHKPSPMPESVRDRTTKSHEYIFLLTKKATYFYDADAIAEPAIYAGDVKTGLGSTKDFDAVRQATLPRGERIVGDTRNARSVWTIASQPFAEAHFATFPPELPERCIKAGSKLGDTILDPFSGAGTTGLVADRLQRHYIGIELNGSYRAMSQERIRADAPLFAGAAT